MVAQCNARSGVTVAINSNLKATANLIGCLDLRSAHCIIALRKSRGNDSLIDMPRVSSKFQSKFRLIL